MPIQLFPHVLVRVAGDTFSYFEKLHFDAVFAVAEELFSTKQVLHKCKQELSDIIYGVITTSEPEMQKKLLNAKRDVFNGRTLTDEKTALLRQYLPPDTEPIGAKALETYLSLKSRIQELTDKGEKIYHDEFIARRGALRELVQGKSFQEGLLLSSQSLLSSIHEHYLKLDPEKFTNKDRQTEKGLVKYLSRMYSKTTPFSTFTNLTMARVEAEAQHQNSEKQASSVFSTPEGASASIKSHIRLNNMLYQFLKALLTKSPVIARCLPIRPNPTIQKTATQFLFLTNSNNVEAFQRVPPSPILDLFLELIGQHTSGLTIRDFAKLIIDGEYIEADTEQIEAYIKQLVEYGFFEYNIGVSGIDPDWDIKLRAQLAPLTEEFPLLGELSTVLERIRLYAEQYGTAPLEERKRILTEAHSLFRAVCMKIHEEAGLPEDERKTPEERAAEARQKMKEEQEKAKAKKAEETKADDTKTAEAKGEEAQEENDGENEEKKEEAFKHQSNTYFSYKPEQMFYEDTTFEVTPKIAHDELMELCTSLHTLQQTLWTFGGMKDEQDTMLHFFTQKYGTEATVDLITFYEEYFREWKKPEAERQQKVREEQAKKAREKQEQEKATKERAEKTEIIQKDDDKKDDIQKNEEPKQETEKQDAETTPAAPIIPRIKERQERNKTWTDKYAEILRGEIPHDILASSSETIHLHLDSVQRVRDELQYPAPREVENRSYGMFVQFFREHDADGNERLMGVLNASLSGFGKMISRFMHIFDDSVTDDVRSWNSARAGEAIFIEDCDASYFNANLHPPLMPYEIWMPGGHNTLPAEKQIPVTDLCVRLAEGSERLELRHKTLNKTAFVFDLGFQGHGGRSQLFQLLEKFTRAEYLSFYPLLNALSTASSPKVPQPSQNTAQNGEQEPVQEKAEEKVQEKAEEKVQENAQETAQQAKPQPRVRTRPRVVYEDQLVLQRKAWFVPKELLPLRTKQETDWQYFERLNSWRSELGMPEEIFLFVNPRENQGNQDNIDTDAAKRVTRDDYKPQYISFRNPFMVKLFESLLSKVMSVLKIEEMLPNSEQMAQIAGQKYVTECVVQWYV